MFHNTIYIEKETLTPQPQEEDSLGLINLNIEFRPSVT
jgi:hypothetical protein